jgi:hypothetical protein
MGRRDGRHLVVDGPRRCRPCAHLETRPLTPSVAPRPVPGTRGGTRHPNHRGEAVIGRPTLAHRSERTASSTRSSNLVASLVQDAFPRRVPLESPAFAERFFVRDPPPFVRLCRRPPASDARSLLALARRELDRDTIPVALHPWAAVAKRRSSTSATDPIREHHHEPFEPRPPRARSPLRAAAFASAEAEDLRVTIDSVAFRRRCRQPAEKSRVRGANVGAALALPPPRRSLAVEALPQPDRLGHLLSRTRGNRGRSGLGSPSTLVRGALVRIRRARARFREPSPLRAASPGPPRRGTSSAAPEVPSVDGHPRWGLVLSPGCPQPVDFEPGAFAFVPWRVPPTRCTRWDDSGLSTTDSRAGRSP